ncbi:hypothetical protein DRO44_04655 [Candidatus Bathyarchaeota archaeon]|nr:MAG: hypothetical protein DRO44_04655 [Candidatus Bathyarchaeota archaeon]
MTQCLCYGKPMILVPTPSHTEQISNAKQAEDLGVAKIILQEKLNRDRLLKGIKQMLESTVQERLKTVQKEVLKYDGLKKAVETIFEVIKK